MGSLDFKNFLAYGFDVCGLGPLVGVGRIKLNSLVLGEGLETFGDDAGVMDEEILRAVIRRDESISFLIIKPLNFTFHNIFLALICKFYFLKVVRDLLKSGTIDFNLTWIVYH